MTYLLPVVIGALFAGGLYMMMRRSAVKLLLGLVLLSHGANLLIFTVGGLRRGRPPLISGDAPLAVADPLPQALVLTAIVISFGLLAFALALVARTVAASGTDDLEEMRKSEL
jgi:multicomponent Na+:H+ antiporter subunit C